MDIGIGDRVAREREAYETGLRRDVYDRILSHAQGLYHAKRITAAGDWLRPCAGGRALELGANSWTGFLEANDVRPAELTCINISARELNRGRQQARTTRLQPDFRIMDAQALAFPDEHFDAVFGTAILHHLDLSTALKEVTRVLKPGGRIVFGEPLDNNPVGRMVRRLTPAARTEDERPLRHHDLALIEKSFSCRFLYEQFLSVPAGIVSPLLYSKADNALTRAAFVADERLLAAVPAMGPWFRRVLILGEKRA